MNLDDWKYAHFISPEMSSNNWRQSKCQEIDYIFDNIPSIGFIAEFGTWKNFSVNYIASKTDKEVYGFDSLIGLPEEMDLGTHILPKYFNFDNAEPLADNVKFYKGWFANSIPVFLNDVKCNAAFVNIDGDHYLSAVDVLTGLNSRIVPGTIIRFDELVCWRTVYNDSTPYKYLDDRPLPYFTKWQEHEWKALQEWCETFNRKVEPICRSWFLGGTIRVIK